MSVYRPPQSTPDERARHEIEHGRRIAHTAAQIWNWESPSGRRRAQRRADLFIRLGRIDHASRVLEVGCGTGIFTALVAARTAAQLSAIDISPDLLDQARQRPECRAVRFLQGNIERGEGLADGAFDVIFGSSILHHVDLHLALPHLVAALAPGGRFVFTEPNRRNPQIWMERNVALIRRLTGTSPDEMAFRRGEVRRLLADAGLINTQVEPFDWLHPITPAALIGFVSALGTLLELTPLLRHFSGSLSIYAEKPAAPRA